MADSSKFSLPCDASSRRQISFSIFHSSGSRVGTGAKGLQDYESVWSPTSPLDFRLFSNLSNPFTAKSSRPPSQTGHKQLDCSKVGLGIISSLVNETKLNNNEILGEVKRKSIIFRPQVKTSILKFSQKNHESLASYLKTYSLPKNYVISLPSETESEVENFDDVSGKKELISESEAFKGTTISSPDSSSIMSLPPVRSLSSQDCSSLKTKPKSRPISIDFRDGYIGSLSAKEIELSEDYTCIISHGPNPKTTHIFGDCVLECHDSHFTEFCKKEEPTSRTSQVARFSEGSPPPLDNVLRFCYSCNKKLEMRGDSYISRGEIAFCSYNCRSDEISVEEELEKTGSNSAECSPESSYHDLFLAGLLASK